jgi:hypothetical protein
MLWQVFHLDVFIDRAAILQDIFDWADAKPNIKDVNKRVCSIIAPPGTGKTWLLQAVRHCWKLPDQADNASPPKRFVIWVDVPKLVNRDELNNRNQMINQAAAKELLNQMHDEVRRLCGDLNPLDFDLALSRNIQLLVDKLCGDCKSLKYAPMMIVDGYDEVTPDQAGVVAERVLAYFVSKECSRMLVAHRYEYALRNDTLRRHQRRIMLGML